MASTTSVKRGGVWLEETEDVVEDLSWKRRDGKNDWVAKSGTSLSDSEIPMSRAS